MVIKSNTLIVSNNSSDLSFHIYPPINYLFHIYPPTKLVWSD